MSICLILYNNIGFAGTKMKGSEHNDPFIRKNIEKNDFLAGKESAPIKPKTNNAGGILGGISSGENIVLLKKKTIICNKYKK